MIPQKTSSSAPGEPATLEVLAVANDAPLALRAEAPALVMPIESAVITARLECGAQSVSTVDRSLFLVLPAGGTVTVTPATAVARLALLSFHPPLFGSVARSYRKLGLDPLRWTGWLATATLLPRTVWFHEIVHRYVFERHALGERNNVATRFLEVEILKEVYYLFRDRDEGADRATVQRKHSAPVEAAIAYLEAHLFEPGSMAELARHARSSESTLLRAFRRDLGCTPVAYWRQRKLEGALDLLRGGRHSVAEIAVLVGYDNATAFGHAFRLRFGRPPSFFRPRGPLRPAP